MTALRETAVGSHYSLTQWRFLELVNFRHIWVDEPRRVSSIRKLSLIIHTMMILIEGIGVDNKHGIDNRSPAIPRSSTDTTAMISTEPAPSQARTVRQRDEVHEFMVQQARESNMGRQDTVPRQGPLVLMECEGDGHSCRRSSSLDLLS